jgi:hypothetical protein
MLTKDQSLNNVKFEKAYQTAENYNSRQIEPTIASSNTQTEVARYENILVPLGSVLMPKDHVK